VVSGEERILNKTWHHSKFSDIKTLVGLKEKKGLKISLAFPTLNEEATIGKEILVIRTELKDRYPLLDEIAVIDSSSKDNTRKVAEDFGARECVSKAILPTYGSFRGKGENLWKSLYARLKKYGKANIAAKTGGSHISLERYDAEHRLVHTAVPPEERPPMLEIPEYRAKFHR
jgi:hypothetical protein